MANFEKILRLGQPELKGYCKKKLKEYGYSPTLSDGYLYAEGTLPVMLVAHLDRKHKDTLTSICKSIEGIWMSPEGICGDDRCGVFAVLQLARDYNCHILFTEDEEIGCVGAGKFVKSGIKPDLNYIIQIDRRGSDDAVYYNCDNGDFEKFITQFGFKTAIGSCSDISKVAPHLGAAAVNLSSGYYSEHTMHEYIKLSDLWKTVARVRNILDTDVMTKYEYIEKKVEYKYGGLLNMGRADYYDYDKEFDYWKKYYARKYSKHKGKKKSEYKFDDKVIEDVIWLSGGDWYIKDDTHSYLSCSGYGISPDGRVFFWDEEDNITEEKGIFFVDAGFKDVSLEYMYNLEKAVKGMEGESGK